jgi:hypothetical protein
VKKEVAVDLLGYTLLAVVILAIAAVVVVVPPVVLIWSLNALFPSLAIPVGFRTVAAATLLMIYGRLLCRRGGASRE